MLRQERVEDPEEATRLSLQGWQAGIWTAMPGIVESVDLEKMTCEVQPAIKGIFRLKDGSEEVVTMPLCLDVPISFATGGGFTHTFPLQKGDEGMIIFMSRCLDAWWQNGGVQPQAELRMHDLSDGTFIAGIRSQPRVLENINATDCELRNDDGDVKVRIAQDEIEVVVKEDVSALFTEEQIGFNAHGSTIVLKEGEIDIDATTVKINGIPFETHRHTGVTAGPAQTGGPV